MKVNITTNSHASRQVVASMPGSGTDGPKIVDNKSARESHTQQSHGLHDYVAQRMGMKEIAAQCANAKATAKREEERRKE